MLLHIRILSSPKTQAGRWKRSVWSSSCMLFPRLWPWGILVCRMCMWPQQTPDDRLKPHMWMSWAKLMNVQWCWRHRRRVQDVQGKGWPTTMCQSQEKFLQFIWIWRFIDNYRWGTAACCFPPGVDKKISGCLQMGFLDWSQGPLQQSSDLRFRSPHLSNSFSFGNFSSVRGTERTRMMWWRRWVRRWRRRSKTWWSHEDVKMSHGWLIGTLIMVYSNPYITG